MADGLFRAAGIPRRLMPVAIARHVDLHHVGNAGNAVDPEHDPHAVLSAPRHCGARFGLRSDRVVYRLPSDVVARAGRKGPHARGEGFGDGAPKSADEVAADGNLRERASASCDFDPAEIGWTDRR